MFIRIKKIKKYDYAYLVDNRWSKKKGARQRVSKYLGRVFVPEKSGFLSFYDYIGNDEPLINKSGPKEIIEHLLAWVLDSHGFKADDMVWNNGGYTVDLKNLKVEKGGKSAVLYINNDYLCSHTLRKLLRFKSSGDQKEVGLKLAKAFVGAGIPVPEEIFIHVFCKLYKEGQSFVK